MAFYQASDKKKKQKPLDTKRGTLEQSKSSQAHS